MICLIISLGTEVMGIHVELPPISEKKVNFKNNNIIRGSSLPLTKQLHGRKIFFSESGTEIKIGVEFLIKECLKYCIYYCWLLIIFVCFLKSLFIYINITVGLFHAVKSFPIHSIQSLLLSITIF